MHGAKGQGALSGLVWDARSKNWVSPGYNQEPAPAPQLISSTRALPMSPSRPYFAPGGLSAPGPDGQPVPGNRDYVAPGATPAKTVTEQMAATRAREAMARQKAATPAARIIAARPATKAVKPGATPSTRGRTVDRPAATPAARGSGAAGAGVSPSTQMTYQQMMARSGYRPASAQAPGMTYQQMMAQSGYSPNGPGGFAAPATDNSRAMSQNQIADFIATATPTAPVSPYATMNQYGGTTGPMAISVQDSQQAAARAARNATADQLGSAEFRATLDQLLREAGLAPQFGTPDAQLALRDYRP